MNRDQVVKWYLNNGWSKRLEFDWIEIGRDRRPRLIHYTFNADTMTCDISDDVQLQLSFLQLRPHGVIWTCGACGKSDGPIAMENGRRVSEKEVTIEEAWEIIRKTGQAKPVGLDPVTRRGGRRGRITL